MIFGDTEIVWSEFHSNESPILPENVDIHSISISEKVSSGGKKL